MGYEDEPKPAVMRAAVLAAPAFPRTKSVLPLSRALFRSTERKTMTLEERLAAVEQELADLRRSRLREAVKDLQEAMTVNTYAQARLERSHQDLAEGNESHARAMKEHAQAIREIDDRMGIPPKPHCSHGGPHGAYF